ncbi:MAG: transglutaminase domain-containing protein, partial [Candidatus Omnitrophica bacterium]|nr:transglutaminase domain-containing protein [Candidatus Omnitrophota bacterium]
MTVEMSRVIRELPAALSPTRHFACVDMVTADGQFYDIDFFLEGTRGGMKATETTVHKLNGRPYYVWEQAADKTWFRAPVDGASNALLGVKNGRDRFTFRYQAEIPAIKSNARMWMPLASPDDFQKVRIVSIESPEEPRTLNEKSFGNRVLYFELGPKDSGSSIVVTYDVERLERGATPGDPEEAARYLGPAPEGATGVKLKATAEEAVRGREGDLMRARALYDHVIDTMTYKRCGTGWGVGDVQRVCNLLEGNCSDLHAYFIGLARAVGIPARFAIGAAIPSDRDEGGIEGCHCWAEFYAEGEWWPVDISEANKFSALSMYYFGHHPANRIELSRGRDLVPEPGPKSGPI